MKSVFVSCLGVLLAPAVSAWSAGVWIDSSQVTISSTGVTVINARLRASTGDDQLLANGGGTTATSGSTLSHNLGTVGTISARDYAFTLEHRIGQGLIFRLVDNQSTPQTWLLAYGGGFSPGLPVHAPSTMNVASQGTLGGVAPGGLPGFNSLRVEVQATDTNPANPAELAILSDMYFSSPTLSVEDGAFDSMRVTPTTPGQTFGEMVGGVPVTAPAGFAYQRLVADEPLTAHNWTLAGTVHLQRSGGGDGEGVRMVIYGQQVAAVFPPAGPIPEPAVVTLLGLSGALAWRRRRRG